MFNTDFITKPGPLSNFFQKERLLYNELFIYNSNNSHLKPLTINSTVLQVEEHFDMRYWFNTERINRKNIAPVWKSALEFWIYEIELYMLGIGFDNENNVNIDYNHRLIKDVYTSTTIGKIKYLYEYASYFIFNQNSEHIEDDPATQALMEVYLKDIARGVSIAYLLPVLKAELIQLTDQPQLGKAEIEALDTHKEKDKLTTKQQIFLLEKLGIFESPNVQSLTEQKRGVLFGHLLNRNEKNTEDTIRNRYSPLPEKIKTPVINLLKELGWDKIG